MFEHGIKIGEKHTYDDWGLVCTRIEISDPEQKTYFVEIPGRDGVIDLSEALVGDVKYGNREIRMEFIRRQDFAGRGFAGARKRAVPVSGMGRGGY